MNYGLHRPTARSATARNLARSNLDNNCVDAASERDRPPAAATATRPTALSAAEPAVDDRRANGTRPRPTTGRTCSTTRAKACCATTGRPPDRAGRRRRRRHVANEPRLYWGGVMHYVEARRPATCGAGCAGTIGTSNAPAAPTAAPGTAPARWTSPASSSTSRTAAATAISAATTPRQRRRTTLAAAPSGVEVTYGDDVETGELGFEDIVNTDGDERAQQRAGPHVHRRGGNDRFSEDLNGSCAPCRGRQRADAARSRPTAALPRLLPLGAAAGDNSDDRQLW